MLVRIRSSRPERSPRVPPLRAFTLIEVLVVVAIIALLVAVLIPSLSRARAQAKTVVCSTQIGQLMRAALMYKGDFRDRLPGTGVNDAPFYGSYETGARNDWLTWSGTWTVVITSQNIGSTQFWKKVPRNGRLWRYYHDEKLLKCPASENSNGKLSYSTPENVAMAMKGANGRNGLPPLMDSVKHPSFAIQFLDEDEENGINSYSVDDGFGEPDLFADRHLGRATVAFFDGHSEAQYFPRGPGSRSPRPRVRYPENRSTHPFEAWMIQIAPFNSRFTPRPWKIRAWNQMPKYKCSANYPAGGQHTNGPGCE